jgi:hypothetical protein
LTPFSFAVSIRVKAIAAAFPPLSVGSQSIRCIGHADRVKTELEIAVLSEPAPI